MLPYRVISMDACLIRLTTVTDAENKFTRSISLGYTWLHLQFYSSFIQLRAFIKRRLSKQRQKICICLDRLTSWRLIGFQNPRQWFLFAVQSLFCWFSRGPATLTCTSGGFYKKKLTIFVDKSHKDHLGNNCVCVWERERVRTDNVYCNHH